MVDHSTWQDEDWEVACKAVESARREWDVEVRTNAFEDALKARFGADRTYTLLMYFPNPTIFLRVCNGNTESESPLPADMVALYQAMGALS